MILANEFSRVVKTYKDIRTVLKGSTNVVIFTDGLAVISLDNQESRTQIHVDCECNNNCSLPADTLSKLVKLKIVEDVGVTDNSVIVNGVSIPSTLIEELPVIQSTDDYEQCYVSIASEFKKALKDVSVAVAQETSRPILCNVLLDKDTLVAVDGFRIFTRRVGEGAGQVLLKPHIVKALLKLLPNKSDEIVKVFVKGEQFYITFGDYTVFDKSDTGEFMKWEKVFTDDLEYRVTIDRSKLIEQLEFAANLQEEPKKAIVKFTIEKDCMDIQTLNVKVSNMPCETIHQPTRHYNPLIIAARITYLLDSLKSSKSEKVNLGFISALTPIFIDKQDLILPIRLKD